MKLFLNIFLTTIIINIKISLESEYSLIFPFIIIHSKDPELTASLNLTSMNSIMKNILLNDIYIKFEIGSPSQIIYLLMSANINDFFISKENAIFEEKYSKTNGDFYFDPFKSSTFNYQFEEDRGHIYFSQWHISEYVKDNFIFYTSKKNNKINIKDFNFLLAYKVDGPIHGIVGLKGGVSEEIRKNDIFSSLKNYNLIKNNIWYLIYDNNNNCNGSLIIGNYPHSDENIIKKGKNELLKIKHFKKVYSTIDKKADNQWGLKLDKIYLKNISSSHNTNEEILIDCEKCKNIILNPNIGVVIGPQKFKVLFERLYLNKFLNNRICFQPMIEISINNSKNIFYYYYCNSSYIQEMKREFNPIIFEHKGFNFNFTLNFDDLYVKKQNYIFLKIIFDANMGNNWILGNPFLTKYLFTFNSDTKEIGFYSKNINDNIMEENYEKKSKNVYFNIFIKIIIGIFLIILGIIIGKKLFGLRRKIRANELEENFEYKPANNPKQIFL